MTKEASLKFKIDEQENYFSEEINHNDLMRKKYKNTCKYLKYVKHLLILASAVTGCVSISVFSSLVPIL